MAGARKLQAEVDRTLKAIGEHMTEFESIWDKVVNAATQSLKEKYENDLKKEIKKLQRMRDSLKIFIQSNEIKIKKPLIDARKLIETKMEQFKILERETKTKAYSREGLNQNAQKRNWNSASGGEMGEEERREEMLEWLDSSIDALQSQIDEAEEKIEAAKLKGLSQPVVKAKKGKKTDPLTSINDEAQRTIERHAWHIARLNQIKESIEIEDNFLPLDSVDDIKDDVEFYVNNNNEPDFNEDETIYDALQLDEQQNALLNETEIKDEEGEINVSSDNGNINNNKEEENTKDNEINSQEEENDVKNNSPSKAKQAAAKAAANTINNNNNTKTLPSVTINNKNPIAANPVKPATPTASAPVTTNNSTRPTINVVASPKPAAAVASTTTPSAAANVGQKKIAPTVSTPQLVKPMESMASIVMKSKVVTTSTPQTTTTTTTAPITPAVVVKPPTPTPQTPQTAAATITAQPTPAKAATATIPVQTPVNAPSPSPIAASRPTVPVAPNVKPIITTAPSQSQSSSASQQSTNSTLSPFPRPSSALSGVEPISSPIPITASNQFPTTSPSISHSSPPQSFASSSSSLLSDRSEYFSTLSSIDVSLKSFPHSIDSDRIKSYIPRNPYRTPPFFPLHPAPIFDDSSLFDKFGLDTLFFIFYFQQGTPHQYLAARELKKQSWRYHKNFLTWFQRHEEPKLTTEEFEQGTYVYFDYESGWCQRIKQEFTFEYRHLEDELTIITQNTQTQTQQQQQLQQQQQQQTAPM